jgi:thiol:disulfide interchange protein DsbC
MRNLLLITSAFVAPLFSASAFASEAVVRKAIAGLNPQAKIESIKPGPTAAWFEVDLGGQLVYVSADGKNLMQGQWVDIASKRNRTEESQRVIRRDVLKLIDAKTKIVYAPKAEAAKHKIVVFTDSDCGFCRKLHSEMASYHAAGIEVQYLFYPRAGIPSQSATKAEAVFCAADRNKAMDLIQTGQNIDFKQCPNPVQNSYALGNRLGVGQIGTPSIFLSDGSYIPGYVSADQLLAQLEKVSAR